MCDFPNVENNDLELEALNAVCLDWDRRIAFLPKLFRQGHADESLILCCCYIEGIGKWFYKNELDGKESFIKALMWHGENQVFRKVNPKLLFDQIQESRDAAKELSGILNKLPDVLGGFENRFHSWEEISTTCKAGLPDEDFNLLGKFLWMGTLACLAYKITRCEGVPYGSITAWDCGETVLDFQLLYPALKRIFERARSLIMSGKLRVY